jgi:hypothetical protein
VTQQKRVLSCVLKPVFDPSVDVSTKLRSYRDSRFDLRLFTTEVDIAGEVLFRDGPEGASKLRQQLTANYDVDAQDIAAQTANTIARVLDCEAEVFAGPLWFSFCDGLFEFSRTVTCEDGAVEIATQLMAEHYALPFLRTLGNVIGLS